MGQLNLEVQVRSHLQEIGTLVQDKEETELGQLQEVKHVDLNNLEHDDVQKELEQPWALKQMDPRKDKDKDETDLREPQEVVKHVDLKNLEQVDVQEGLEQPRALKQMDPRKDKEQTDLGQLQEVKLWMDHFDLHEMDWH